MDPQYFARYLELEVEAGNKGDANGRLSAATVVHYKRGLRRVNQFLAESSLGIASVYEAMTPEELEEIERFLKESPDFARLNAKGHRMYSAAFNHYLEFIRDSRHVLAKGRDVVDIVLPPRRELVISRALYPRDRLLAAQSLAMASYDCEANPAHKTFMARNAGYQYMEGHHLVPLRWQKEFPRASLDCYANIVCLCPTCHRMLHFAEDAVRGRVFDELFEKRSACLARSGIDASRGELKELAFRLKQ